MHAGELETSILLHAHPELIRDGYQAADWTADDRRHLLIAGRLSQDQAIGLAGFLHHRRYARVALPS